MHHPDSVVQWEVALSSMSRGDRPAVQRFIFRKDQYVETIRSFVKQLSEEQDRGKGENGKGRGIVLYTEHRSIQEGGLEKIFGNRKIRKVG